MNIKAARNILMASVLGLSAYGCDNDDDLSDHMENAGENIEEGAEEVADEIDDAT